MSNHYTSTYPTSPFVQKAVAVRKDEGGLYELIDRRLTTTRPDRTIEERVLTDAEIAEALDELFGVTIAADELARLTVLLPPS
jgi:N-hydroxyarylamine O-acetyltransferase